MRFRAVVYPAFTLLIPVTWFAAGGPLPYPSWADIALGVPFLLDAASNVFGLFAIRRFDIIPHTVGWFCLSVAFGLAIAPLAGERWIAFGLVLGFGAVIDILWEAGEFAMDARRCIGARPDLREHDPGPAGLARGRGRGSGPDRDRPVAGARDPGDAVRLVRIAIARAGA